MPDRKDLPYPYQSDATGWFVGIIVALALLAIGYLVFAAQPARASDIAGVERGTYLLHVDGSPGCTAQAVTVDGKLLLLTANHCVTNDKAEYSVNRITYDADKFDKKVFEAVYYVDVVKRDKTSDAAVLRPIDDKLKLDTVDLATVEEAKAGLTKGADVLVAGYPGTSNSEIGDLVFTEGLFTGLSKSFVAEVTVPMYRTTVSVHYGNSGGGLYVEVGDTWKLVGITSQLDPERMWANSLFVTRDAIEKAVRLAPKPATDK